MKQLQSYFKLHRKNIIIYILFALTYFAFSYFVSSFDSSTMIPVLYTGFFILVVPGVIAFMTFSKYINFPHSKKENYILLATNIIVPSLIALMFSLIYRFLIVLFDGFFISLSDLAFLNLFSLPLIFVSILGVLQIKHLKPSIGKVAIASMLISLIYCTMIIVSGFIDLQNESGIFSMVTYLLLFLVIPLISVLILFNKVTKL